MIRNLCRQDFLIRGKGGSLCVQQQLIGQKISILGARWIMIFLMAMKWWSRLGTIRSSSGKKD